MWKWIGLGLIIFLLFTEFAFAEGTWMTLNDVEYQVIMTMRKNISNKNKLWEQQNLNQILNENPELCIKDDKFPRCLANSEYCPICGAFSYYHLVNGSGKRKCIRCLSIWSIIERKYNLF